MPGISQFHSSITSAVNTASITIILSVILITFIVLII
jgi:hypothetical protein